MFDEVSQKWGLGLVTSKTVLEHLSGGRTRFQLRVKFLANGGEKDFLFRDQCVLPWPPLSRYSI